jgi:GrpB-like predicted nucleotidyltransferase (UPF0157 family)
MSKVAKRVREVVREEIEIVPYDSNWPALFQQEADHLRIYLPEGIVRRIEHFGSTAVPGLAAKPIIDMLVEVTNLRVAREKIAPILKSKGYEYFWRPTFGDNIAPWYAFFIKRDDRGVRTYHIHMVTRHPNFAQHWDRLLFRNYLIAHPETAREYARLKIELARLHPNDRPAYGAAKAKFIERTMLKAKNAQ